MKDQAAATRYARALFEVSRDSGDMDRAERDLAAFQDLVDGHPTMERALLNPAIPPSRKRAVVTAVLDRIPETAPAVRRLLRMLAERDRLGLLPALIEAYRDALLDHRQVVRARVTTAEPLETGRITSITRTLEAATGRQVRLETSVDTSLVGGMVTQIGGTVFDGSLAHHLDSLRQRFITA